VFFFGGNFFGYWQKERKKEKKLEKGKENANFVIFRDFLQAFFGLIKI
jgi:hypothetical protein